MSVTKKILQSRVGYDLTTGKYVIAETIGGVDKYWTGSIWDAVFANAQQFTFGTGTIDGSPAWTWIVPNAVDPAMADDELARMIGWESGVTPALGSSVAVTDSFGVDSLITIVQSSATTQAPVPYIDLVAFDNEDRTIEIDLIDQDENPVSLAGHDCVLVVSDWLGNRLFQEAAEISSTQNNAIIFTIEAANAHANANEIWPMQLWDNSVNAVLVSGTLYIQPALAPT